MTTLPPAALEAARSAIRYMSHPETPWTDEQVGAVIHAYLSAARSAPEAGKAVVKPLEWRVFCSNSGNCDAETPFGEYVIQNEEDRWVLYLIGDDASSGLYPTVKAAKAAAQADYEQRILSALAPVPAPSGAEPLAWRRERDGHLIDQPRPGYAPLYASPQAVPVEDVAGPIEQMAEAMWRAEVKDFPAAAKVRAIAPWSEESPNVQDKWRALATVAAGTVAAALTSLSAERDSWRRVAERLEGEKQDSEAEATSLRRRLEEARKALEPFHHIDRALSYSHLQGHIGAEDTIPVPAKAIRTASDVFKAGATE